MTSYAGSEPSTAEVSPSCSVRDNLPPVSILTRCPQPDAHKCSPLAFPPEHFDPGVTWVLCHAWVPVRPTRSPPSQDLQQPEVPSLPSEAHEVLRTGQVGEMRSASPNPVAYPETPWHGLTPSPAASEPAVNTAGIPAEVSVLSRHARSVPSEGTRSLGGSSAPASSRCQLPLSFRRTLSTDTPSSSPSSDSSFSSSDRSRLPLRRGSVPIRRDFAHSASQAPSLHSASESTRSEHIDVGPDTRVRGSTARSSAGEEFKPRLVTFDPSAYRVKESPMNKLDAITESESSDSDMDSSEDDQSTWHRDDPQEFARQPRNRVESKKPAAEEPRTKENHRELTSQGTGNGDTNEGDQKEDEIQTKTASPYYEILGLTLGSSPKEARLAYMQRVNLAAISLQRLGTNSFECCV